MAERNQTTHLYSLPNELRLMTSFIQLLVQILTPFTTQTLLPLTSISHRFHAIVLRILHYRLLLAASLKEYKLILECYHPSSRLTDPHSFCTYLGTPGLSDEYEGKGSLYEDCETAERLGRLSAVYSRFRPEPSGEQSSRWPRNFLEPPSAREDEDAQESNGNTQRGETTDTQQFFKKQISLDEFEGFSQLCTMVNLVKLAPNSTRLISAINVEEGIIRVWRHWLKEHAGRKHGDISQETSKDDDGVLWVDNRENVGLKLRVKEKKWNRQAPVLIHEDEEMAVTYEVEIEEIRIRTTRLLLTVEQSLAEQQNYSKAIIIGPVHVATII
ncbi:hypothetical protein PISL3812_03894 [Talaromyces islandicus]|uniref:Uncharacterized protein n=1 Tax=Talaromyces islandicus TaxID=28573 RepID=A0A0U1LUV5_TALIS|nr:hypothetical protein PISL3812_03894 [Talaromyces islandicus]